MKSYIIRLDEFPNSVEWAKKSVESGAVHNWEINYFKGINGSSVQLSDYNIHPNPRYKKGKKLLENAGVRGCFLSHYSLWNLCKDTNEEICIFEHDITINSPMPNIDFKEVLKFSTGPKGKNIYKGEWWAGAMAYCITPLAADKLIKFTHQEGAMPADTMLCKGIVDIQFYDPINTIVTYVTDDYSFTKDYV